MEDERVLNICDSVDALLSKSLFSCCSWGRVSVSMTVF